VSVRLALFAEDLAEESGLFGIVCVALATITFRNAFKGDLNMLATT
jgi:hypothetical protein